MSSQIFHKLSVQTVRKNYNSFRLILAVNKSTCSNSRVNFHIINENQSSHLFYTNKFLSQRTLSQRPVIFNISFQRNLSTKPIDEIKEAEKKLVPETTNSLSEDLSTLVTNVSLDDIPFVKYAEEVLIELHKELELPWWATIACSAVAARGLFLSLAVVTAKQSLKMQLVNMELEEKKAKIKLEVRKVQEMFGLPKYIADEKYKEAIEEESYALSMREKCHPFKLCVLPLFQVPMWLSFTFATKKLCMSSETGSQEAYTELVSENIGWISNLTEIDQYFILPITIGLINLAIVEVHRMSVVNKRWEVEQWKTILARGLSVCLIPAAVMLPAATNIYWLSSSLFGLVQAVIIYSKPSRIIFRMPMLDKKKKVLESRIIIKK